MKLLLRTLSLLLVLAFAAGCTDDAELNGEEVPFDQMDRDTIEVEAGRAIEDTVVVDTTAVGTMPTDTLTDM